MFTVSLDVEALLRPKKSAYLNWRKMVIKYIAIAWIFKAVAVLK